DTELALVLVAQRGVERFALARALADQLEQPLGVILLRQLVGELVGRDLVLRLRFGGLVGRHAGPFTPLLVLAFPSPRRHVTLGLFVIFAGFLLVDDRGLAAERRL